VVQSSQNKNIDIEKNKYAPKCPNCKVSLIKEETSQKENQIHIPITPMPNREEVE
jgi:hypothetical protein